jgi:purine-binding chemotaxis protein CheW
MVAVLVPRLGAYPALAVTLAVQLLALRSAASIDRRRRRAKPGRGGSRKTIICRVYRHILLPSAGDLHAGRVTRMQDQLIFGVGRLLCALPVADVVETVRPLPVEPVAAGDGGGGAVLGVAVIRGEAVPVVDTARLLGDPGADPTRFITASTPRGTVAFAAGDVVGVRTIAAPTPAVQAPAAALVAAVGVLDGRPLLFLRTDAVGGPGGYRAGA